MSPIRPHFSGLSRHYNLLAKIQKMPVQKASFGLCVSLFCSILYLVLHYVTNSINNAIRKPYMDEIFHIPQAQRYCQGNFTYYDPKLTTPPGLYIVSYIRIWIRDKIITWKSELICDTIDLRRTNHLIAIFNFVTLVLIQLSTCSKLNHAPRRLIGFKQRIAYTMDNSKTLDLAKILLTSIAITLLPPLFFFNSLYYTDAGSLLFTLLAYLFSVTDHHLMAASFGFISICFRQTNVIWLFYTASLVLNRIIEDHSHGQQKKSGEKKKQATTPACYPGLLFNRSFLLDLLKKCTPYAIVGVAFIIFVAINKGIVLGDKEAHQPRLHIAQILYFLGFCAVFGSSWVFHVRILKRFLYFIVRNPSIAIVASGLVIYLVSFGKYAHPYLLADNRHLTFYIWRRILDRHNSYVPYLLTPVYLLASISVWHHLRSGGCKLVLLYILCTMLAIVPNGLLEPRYFIMPFVFLRLRIDPGLFELAVEIIQQLTINISMHYLFLHKTFQWSDNVDVQRIMW